MEKRPLLYNKIQGLYRNLPVSMKAIAINILRVLKNIGIDIQTIFSKVPSNPIFVLGNPKSGTTAIAALLAEMVDLSVTLDLRKEIKNPTYHRVIKKEMSFSKFIKINKFDFSKDIIKEPNLTFLYKELEGYFHNPKFVFILRDPRENIRSILNRLKIPGDLHNLDDDYRSEITKAWELIINLEWFGLKGENYIERLANRWNLTSDVFLKNNDKMVLTRYEDFLEDKKEEILRLAQKLGLSKVKDIANKVDTQFQPPGNKDVSWSEFFGNKNLQKIESICSNRMKTLGYPV